ncbi:MAG: hypothetical protein JXR89_05355 [Deltaproteobacteria bacterium]|nr:hypothetical protein [Deltaproteobacteria bacterium]
MGKLIKILVVLVLLGAAGGMLGAAYYFAPVIAADERGVVMNGKAEADKNLLSLAPGKHYWFISGYNPISATLSRVKISEKEVKPVDSGQDSLTMTTADGDHVKIELVSWYRVIPEKAGLFLACMGAVDVDGMVKDLIVSSARELGARHQAQDFYDGKVQSKFMADLRGQVNQELSSRGLELSVCKCNSYHYSESLLKKIDDIKKANYLIEVNRIKVKAAAVAALETEEAAKGRKRAALQEAEARRESVIMASEAQIVAAQNWVAAEKIKAEAMLFRSKAKAESMQLEAAARVFSGPDGERFLRYQIADLLAEAWARRDNAEIVGLDNLAASVNALSEPLQELNPEPGKTIAPERGE